MKSLKMWVSGLASLVALATFQPLQAQTTIDPVFFAGVVGETGPMQTVQGDSLAFTGPLPFYDSVFRQRIPGISGGSDDNDLVSVVQVRPTSEVPTEPTFASWTLDYRTPDGTYGGIPVGTGELYIIIFADALHRDAFIYYLQQRDLAATPEDYLYFSILCGYEFWIGQENTGLALYSYYTGMATYLRDTQFEENPEQAMYDYYYNLGLGAYYYFEGTGDLDSANLAFAYYYELAIAELPPEEELPPE